MAQQQDKGPQPKVRKLSGRMPQDRAEVQAQLQARSQVLEGNDQFTTNLYQVLSKEEGNVVFSPISVHAALAMAYQGALGKTAQQLAASMHVPDAEATAKGYSFIMNRLNSVENVTLLMANKIFLMEGHTLLSNFKTAVTKHFLSEVQQVNFGLNAEAANTINSWVKTQTKDKIQDVISKAALNALTRLVLVNAIYFKGNWKYKFDKGDTKTEPFYLNDVDKVDVQMMHIKNKRFYYKNDVSLDAQVLQLLYTNEDLSLIIILPNKRNGIRDLEQKLATTKLSEVTSGMSYRPTEVDVALPRFKIDKIIDLESVLTKLGLGEMFSMDTANFRGMIELPTGENLFITNALQKAFIEVNEEGAEATAATFFMYGGGGGTPEPIPVFVADHPFVYLLSDKATTHLFVGRYSKPDA